MTVTLLDRGEPHITKCSRCDGVVVRYILRRDSGLYADAVWVHANEEMQEACHYMQSVLRGARA